MWTDEKVKTMMTMWNEGHTAAQISLIIGLSRNAVVGKILRLRQVHNQDLRSTGRTAVVKSNGERLKRFEKAFTPPPVVNKTLLDLAHNECRWPLGEMMAPVEFFCGQRVLEGHPYCRHHFNIAHPPAKKK